jgi:ferrochelatase
MPHTQSDSTPVDAILFASFGGPEKQEDVVPFLRNVTRGRGIPDERLEVVGHHYTAFGGRSPINDQNRVLIEQLRAELDRRGIALPIYWGNRNWEPYTADAVSRMIADDRSHALALVTSAYSSYSGCRQYREDFAKALIKNDAIDTFTIDKTRSYFNLPGFLEPVRDGVAAGIAQLRDEGAQKVRVLFSTHSIPEAMSAASGEGGAYVAQHLAACEWVLEQLATGISDVPAWELVYQSRSGAPHIPWLEPDINDRLREIKDQHLADAVVVVPIGFVTDHMEVAWDLDTEAKETAEELGLGFVRSPTAGEDPRFVAALADLVQEHLDPQRERVAVTSIGPVTDVCAPTCCLNGSPHAHPVPRAGVPLDTPAQIARAMQQDPQVMARIAEEQEAHRGLVTMA